MRCFLGLEVPEASHASLELTLAATIRKSPPARWIPAENRHLTLVFLGSVEPMMMSKLHDSLRAACATGRSMRLCFSGGGVFPAGKSARVVWVGLGENSALSRLRQAAFDACAGIGLPVERRVFLPHLTLARCRPAWPAAAGEAWREACARRLPPSAEVGGFEVSGASLFESVQQSEGMRYRVVQSYPLGRGPQEVGRSDNSEP